MPDGEPAKGSTDRNRTIIIVAAIAAVAALGITAIVTLAGHSTVTTAISSTTRPTTVGGTGRIKNARLGGGYYLIKGLMCKSSELYATHMNVV
jgi:hypothetical protein